MAALSDVDTRPRPPQPKWAILLVLCLAVLIVNLDNTILNVALPTLVQRLKASTDELQWIVDAYAMVFGGMMLVAGSLADRYGRKRLFVIGLVIYFTYSRYNSHLVNDPESEHK